ncbi:MAG: trypsin-like peptidase domain-containing protein, partial [Opitutaceae bacterium]
MKLPPFSKFVFLCGSLVVVVGEIPMLRGAEEKSAAQNTLKVKIDSKPINRDASDRVSYAPIVKRTAASVVYIHSSKKARPPELEQLLNDPVLRRYFELPETGKGGRRGGDGSRGGEGRGGATPRTERRPEEAQPGLGSGVVVTSDGYILTNNHLLDGADDVKVSIGESAKRYDARVVGRDSYADVAVLKIEASGLSAVTFGDSDQLQVGDVVLAIGNPLGAGQSVSRGIVSALGRGKGSGVIEDFIQTDAAINPGNSGGALLDSDGRVVGLNTAILSRTAGFAGVGVAIPINLARNVAEQIVQKGRVERGSLGVSVQDLDEALSAQFGAEAGVLVSEVTEDGPAEKAGL